jgi:type I restriction enzyme, R subunit
MDKRMTQIGLTATPKETEYVSNTDYFGEPVFTYSLKQGIGDGFLAPYKVIKVHIDRDVEGYRPELGQLDREGNEVEDRIYNAKDFDRTLVLDDRTVLTAKKITEFLKEGGDRFQKTIVFCVDEEHAARMRKALVNENPDLVAENQRYVISPLTNSDILKSRWMSTIQRFRPGYRFHCEAQQNRSAWSAAPSAPNSVSKLS